MIQKKPPRKLKNPGSFTMPCGLGDTVFKKALCDLGAIMNLIRLSIYKLNRKRRNNIGGSATISKWHHPNR